MGKDRHRKDPPTAATPPVSDLRGLFPGKISLELEQALLRLGSAAAAFAGKYKGKVEKLSGRDLGLAITQYEKISEKADLISAFVRRLDESDGQQAELGAQLRRLVRQAERDTLFFRLDVNKIKEPDLIDRIVAPELACHAPWLRQVRALKDHQLDDAVEQYLHDKNPVTEGVWAGLLADTLADLRFEVRGGKMTHVEISGVIGSSPDAALRREAFNELTRVLGENKDAFSLMANTLADLQDVNDRWRGFKEAGGAVPLALHADKEVADAMVKTLRESYSRTSHRYYAWKARRLGVPRLHPADCAAPLSQDGILPVTTDSARKLVRAAFAIISPDLEQAAQTFFDKDRPVHAAPVSCPPPPHPVLSLAHQAGQDIHRMLAAGQGHLKSQPPPALANVAGVFGKMLSFRLLLEEEEDLLQRRALLAAGIEDMLNGTLRETSLFLFGQRLQEERASKGELPAQRISLIWQETQKELLGPSVNLDALGAETLWMAASPVLRSPADACVHAFSLCVAQSLFDEYDKAADKEAFADAVTDLLKAGGTKRLDDVLAPLGFDARDPVFWKKGIDLMEGFIQELEALDIKIEAVLKSKDDFKAAANDIVLPPRGAKHKGLSRKGPGAGKT